MKNVAAALVLIMALGIAGYALTRGSSVNFEGLLPSLTASAAFSDVETVPAPPLGPTYTNDTFHFSVQAPEEYNVQEFEEEDVHTVTIQDAQGNGIQIQIQPFPEDLAVLTADRIREDIPDMRIADVQEVEIGENRKGVAFMSDNEAFGRASREVWFVFGGNLYQISTYARLDPLLKDMFSTWKFF